MKRVVVGLSGGVDSSVAAFLLKNQGYDVIGLFMKNWHDDSVILANECPWIEDSHDAIMVAEKLEIPFQVIDLSAEYKSRIVDYMFDEYAVGRTPNPDILCNREIKFDVFLEAALKLGADFVATGHYCRKGEIVENGQLYYRLLAGLDEQKDQSYFLCQVNQFQLSKALFPIGDLQKSEVRRIAADLKLATADKKDSQGLCFVGKVSLPAFLQQKLKPRKGDIVEIPSDFQQTGKTYYSKQASGSARRFSKDQGVVVGHHQGAHYYTVGQRKGLNVGGTEKPLFVLETDVEANIIYTGQGADHPGLYRTYLRVEASDIHWIREDLKMVIGERRNYLARIRYRQSLEMAVLELNSYGLLVKFEKAQRGVAAGQFLAWYDGEELIGSGVISD